MDQVDFDTTVTVDTGAGGILVTSLGAFFSNNADALSDAEKLDIIDHLENGAEYWGGGGASGEWRISLAGAEAR